MFGDYGLDWVRPNFTTQREIFVYFLHHAIDNLGPTWLIMPYFYFSFAEIF